MELPLPAPPPAPPPAPGVLHGSVAYTLLFSLAGSALVFAAFFLLRVGEQRPEWRPPASSATSTLRVSPTFRGRLRLLAAAVRATDAEVQARCGVDALASLRCNRACAALLAAAAVPSLLGVLPLALAGGGGAPGFARSTVSNAKLSPRAVNAAITVSVFVAAAAVHAGCAHLMAQLRGARAAADSPASITLLLRGLSRKKVGADAADELLALFQERWPGAVRVVHVPQDRRAERQLESQLARAKPAAVPALQSRLAAVRAHPRGAGIGFVVCRSPAAASRVLAGLAPLRVRGVLGDLCAPASLPWRRADWAPPPETVNGDNIGLGAFGRTLRTLAVNAAVTVVLVLVACPGVLAVVTFDAAALNPAAFETRWTRFIAHAGLAAGLLLQWVPSLLTLLLMQNVLPSLLRWATRAERHLSSGSEARALLSKATTFYNLNVLFVMSFGRVALAALVQQALDCHWAHASGQECTARFVRLLGTLYISSSAAGVMCLLVTSSTFWLSLELLQWRAGVRDLVRTLWRRRSQRAMDAPLLAETHAADEVVTPAAPAPDSHLVFSTAYNTCVFTVALCYGSIAPLVLLPGIVYFCGRCAVDKWTMMVATPAPAAPSDGSLARTTVLLLRASSLLHAVSMAGYMRGRHAGAKREMLALTALACALTVRIAAGALFDLNAPDDAGDNDATDDASCAALYAKAAAYAHEPDGTAELQPGVVTTTARFQFPSG